MATNTKIEKDEALIKTEDPTTAAISYQIPEYCYPPNGYYNLPNNLFQYGGIYNNYNCMGMYPNPQPFLSSSPLSVISEHSDFLSGYKGDSLYSCMMEGYYPTECSQCLSYSYITYPNAIQTTPETSLSQLQASQSSEKNKASETDREDFYPSNDPSPSLQIKSFATYDKNNKLYIPGEVMGRPRLIPSAPMNGQRGVEDVFHLYMEMFFKNLPHPWCLFNIKSSQTQYQAWANFRDNCKVRFYCKDCRDGWTSMNGLIAFYYHISNEEQCGRIGYTICGQKCHHCKNSEFKDPLWYPDEAQKVIANLYYEIAFHCYNLVTPRKIRTQRPGAPKTRHSSSLCQGCTLGLFAFHAIMNEEGSREREMHTIQKEIAQSGALRRNLLCDIVGTAFITTFLKISLRGCDFKSREIDANGQKVRLQIWDTAGQEKSFKITSSYYRGANGIFLIYDVTSEKSFHNIKEWMKNILEVSKEGVRVILLGNSCHLRNDERQVSWERGRLLAQEFDVQFFEVSAHTGTNIKEALQTIVNDILAKKPSVTNTQKTSDMQKSNCILQ